MGKTKLLIAGFVLMGLTSLEATTHNILLIHGRFDSTKGEQFGVFTTDQANYWQGQVPGTVDGHVYYVQWDAWNYGFDSTTANGGWTRVNNAMNQYCNSTNGNTCYIICHSAGCAAFENYLTKSNFATNTISIQHVIAAESAAGGSELADAAFWSGGISGSLKTSYARSAYNHNNMQGLVVRGFGGTNCDAWPQCNLFTASSSSNNTSCNTNITGARVCADFAVSLHSTCGHNRYAFFQDCNSTLPGYGDTAGTYSYHGWWINDSGYSGPYSSNALYNSTYHTYYKNHSTGVVTAIAEYSNAPYSLCP